MKHGRSFFYFFIVLLSLIFPTSSLAIGQEKIQKLVEQEQVSEAYDNAVLQNAGFSADINTNYSYGMAALASGHIPEAIFAFERVLMLDPKNNDALFQLGRAYFMLASFKMAQSYFSQVLTNNPSPELRDQAEAYLHAIGEKVPELKIRPNRLSKYLFINFTNGYDSNINGATTSLVFFLPVGVLNLFPEQTQQSDGFNNTFVKAGFAKPLTDMVAIFTDGAIEQRTNYTVPGFNFSKLDGDVGLNFIRGPYKLSVPLEGEEIYTGNTPFRGYVGVTTELSRTFRKINKIGISSSVQRINFTQNDDRNQYLALFDADTKLQFPRINTRVLADVYYGEGGALDPSGAFLVRDFDGAEIILQWIKLKNHTPFISGIVQNSNYNGINPDFLERRHDNYYEVAVGWNWKFTKHWNLQPQYERIWNKSNIALYQYNRYLAQVSIIYSSY